MMRRWVLRFSTDIHMNALGRAFFAELPARQGET